MQPNFPNGEYLLTDKVTYRFGEPERGDVVVFEAPHGDGDEFIKRIIGLPGETISIRSGKVYINNKMLEEPYLNDIYTSGGAFLKEGGKVTVSEGECFVLGDNRSRSSDSRAFGFITKDKITGRAWLIYWPLKSAGMVPEANYNF